MTESAPAVVGVAELEAWVRGHRVTWETTSRREAGPGEEAPAELAFTLSGRYPGGQLQVSGDDCSLVYERLRSIALHVLEPLPEAQYRIDPFDAAVHLRAEEGWIPEVEFAVVVQAAEHGPSDPGQRQRVLAGIESRLEQLGVQRRHWHEP